MRTFHGACSAQLGIPPKIFFVVDLVLNINCQAQSPKSKILEFELDIEIK